MFVFIERNFGILKMSLFRPTLSDQFNTGPLEVSQTATAISTKHSHVAVVAVVLRLGGATELAAHRATVRSTGERKLHRSLRVKRAPALLCRTLHRFLALSPARVY